ADNVSPDLSEINNLVADIQGKVVGRIPALSQYLIEIEGNSEASGVYQAIDTLKAKTGVVNAVPNTQVLAMPDGEVIPCEGEQCQWYLDRIRAPEAWAIAGGGDEQLGVAIIDFGVDCSHPELACDDSVY